MASAATVGSWFGMRDRVQGKLDLLMAANDKARRHELKSELARLDGKLLLVRTLQVIRQPWVANCGVCVWRRTDGAETAGGRGVVRGMGCAGVLGGLCWL